MGLAGCCYGSDPTPPCTVPAMIWSEGFVLADGTIADTGATAWTVTNSSPHGTFGVISNEFKVNNITVNGVGIWTSEPISIAGRTAVRVSVDVRSAGGLENDATEHGDYLRLYYTIDGGAEVLFAEKLGKINNNKTTDTSLWVNVPGGSSLRVIIRAKATATDEFYFFDNVQVTGQIPVNIQPTATALQGLSCVVGTVSLSGGSAIANAGYAWSGPNGFTASRPDTSVGTPGDYILLVTDPLSGCSATATVTVTQDIAAPASVTANPSSVLTCAQTSVNLTGNSTTSGVSYTWAGPNGFSSNLRVVPTTAPGAYALTVTNPLNGCTAVKAIMVRQNIDPPGNVSIAPPDTLNCTVSSVTLTGSSTTANALYTWSGPDDFSDVAAVTTAAAPGEYTLTVINTANSCSTSVTVIVVQTCP